MDEGHPLFEAFFGGGASRPSPRSGQQLSAFGKQAALSFSPGRRSLTEAVLETVKTAELAPEQVRRVVELANTAAFLSEFWKQGAAHRYVHFEDGPADPEAVLSRLDEYSGRPVILTGDSDYLGPPPQTQTQAQKLARKNSERVGSGPGLTSLFPASRDDAGEAGDADDNERRPEPLRALVAAAEKVASQCSERAWELSAAHEERRAALSELLREVKVAALEDVSLGQVVRAWSSVAREPGRIKRAFQAARPALLSVFDSEEQMLASIAKTAAPGDGPVNEAHPLISAFVRFDEAEDAVGEITRDRDALSELHERLECRTKQALSKHSNRALQGAKWLTGKTRALGETAERGLAPLIGKAPAKALGAAVRFSPHAAGAIALEDTYQRSKRTRAGQAARNFVGGRVPGTRAYQMRMYNYER